MHSINLFNQSIYLINQSFLTMISFDFFKKKIFFLLFLLFGNTTHLIHEKPNSSEKLLLGMQLFFFFFHFFRELLDLLGELGGLLAVACTTGRRGTAFSGGLGLGELELGLRLHGGGLEVLDAGAELGDLLALCGLDELVLLADVQELVLDD